MFLLTAFQLGIATWAGCGNTLFLVTVSGRTSAWHEHVVGYFAHGVLFHPDWSPASTINDVLDAVKSVVIDALDNQDYPHELVIDDLNRGGVHCRSNQVGCVFQNVVSHEVLCHRGILVDPQFLPVADPSWRTARDINFLPHFGERSIRIFFQFRQSRFESCTVRRLRNFTAAVIDQILADPLQTAANLCATVQRAHFDA
jgi:non-ribosomal peptide synthetase component F